MTLTKISFIFLIFLRPAFVAEAQSHYYISADRVFDGDQMHEGWAILTEGEQIKAIGPKEKITIPADAIKLYYTNSTISPGFIEGHSHLFLYAYNITSWDTQVLKESDAYRTARATAHARATLLAGFTTVRDLGTEGAGYADVGLKRAIDEGVIEGPRMIVATRAIVATGAYGPKGYDTDMQITLGAESADGDALIRVVRDQIGKGADVIKVYADYYWGKDGEARPTFSLEELKLIVATAKSSGRPTVAHASTKEGMRRAILAGVETIEHGDELDGEIAVLMKEHKVTFVPTLAAVEKIQEYRGWKKGSSPEPIRVKEKKTSFKEAMKSGVTIGMGGDVGVYTHGENAIEMELMSEYGMLPLDVLRAATKINATAFHLDHIVGTLTPGLQADIVVITGNPALNISDIRNVKVVMKGGKIFKQ